MQLAHRLLHPVAQHSRWALIAGLLLGIFVPPLADATKPWIGHWVAILLFLSAFRVEPRDAFGTLQSIKQSAVFVAVFQMLIPTIVALAFLNLSFTGPMALALVIMISSAPISGSPGLTMITGNDPAPALRLLIATTALLPLTVLLPFSFMPEIGNLQDISWIAFKLFLLIFSAAGLAFGLRYIAMRNPSPDAIKSIDGLTAISMAAVVIGLMTGLSDAIENRPTAIIFTLIAAIAVNFGMQLMVWFSTAALKLGEARASFAICAGNKNMAIFLAALPASVTDPILLFIACYQVPMYLTPTVLGKLYRSQNH
ncbi:MAG: hypothetical protein AAF412_01225 [Pseudomonadota bacterium]